MNNLPALDCIDWMLSFWKISVIQLSKKTFLNNALASLVFVLSNVTEIEKIHLLLCAFIFTLPPGPDGLTSK